MKTLVIAFIAAALVMAILSVVLIGADIAAEREHRKIRGAASRNAAPARPVPAQYSAPMPVACAMPAPQTKRLKRPNKQASVAVVFPNGAKKTENPVFPDNWKVYKEGLHRYLAGVNGLRCQKASEEAEFYFKNGKCVLKCFYVPNDYAKNLAACNAIRKTHAGTVVNLTNEKRLDFVKEKIAAAAGVKNHRSLARA